MQLLQKQSASSYHTASTDLNHLIDHLRQAGYTQEPGRSQHERARMTCQVKRLHHAVVVIYRNGTTLIQGSPKGQAHAHDIFEALVDEGVPV